MKDIILIVILISFIVITTLGKMECVSKAKVLGYKYNYGPIQGCVLEKPNGKKFFLEQLRNIDIDK